MLQGPVGSYVKVKNEPTSAIYKVIDYDDDYMEYILEAQTGPFKGKYRDVVDNDLIEYKLQDGDLDTPTPDKAPESPVAAYDQGHSPRADYSSVSPQYHPDTPPEITIETEKANKLQEEKAAIVDDILDELGSAEEDGDDKANDIMTTVKSINKTSTSGLDKLSTIDENKEEEKDGDEEKDDNLKTIN